MSLEAVVAAIKVALGTVPLPEPTTEMPFTPVIDPADQIGPYPLIVVYPLPGESTPQQHRGARLQPVYQNRDVIAVEWHSQPPDLTHFVRDTTAALDALRGALWRGAVLERFGGTIQVLHAVRTDHYGAMAWGSDRTLGVRLLIELTHATEVTP